MNVLLFLISLNIDSIFSGVLVPGGFGKRGVEGKCLAANWARTNNKPFLGRNKKHDMHYSYKENLKS